MVLERAASLRLLLEEAELAATFPILVVVHQLQALSRHRLHHHRQLLLLKPLPPLPTLPPRLQATLHKWAEEAL